MEEKLAQDPLDRRISVLAARQHGVASREQLLSLGLGNDGIHKRVRAGRLHRVHRGVYAVGHPRLTAYGLFLAAVLTCGGGALLSHASAAKLWRLPWKQTARVNVTVPGRGGRSTRPRILIHRAAIRPGDASSKDGIPVTSPARALLDLAATATARDLDRATNEARVLRLVTDPSLDEQFSRYPRHRGTRALREATRTDPALTRSEAERRLLDLIRAARLPAPETNVRLRGYEVDFLWREQRLVVEVDGYAFHSSRRSFERDRRKDRELHAEGYLVLRITWRELADEREAVVATLSAALTRRA